MENLNYTNTGKIMHSIMINAGHGYNGLGDTGITANGLRECDVTKNISDACIRLLRGAGHDVRFIQSANLTGENAEFQSLECVVDEALIMNPDLFVSIHADNGGLGRKRGYSCTVRYPRSISWAAGTQIQSAVWDATVDYDERYWDRGVNIDAGIKMLNMLVKLPAVVLFKAGYIDNEQDAQMLKEHNAEIGEAVGKGILEFFGYVDSEMEFQYNLRRQLEQKA